MMKEDIYKLLKCESYLGEIAGYFRCADVKFPSFNIERKTFLNDVGKILEIIHEILRLYRYASEERQLEIRKWMHALRLMIEEQRGQLSTINEEV